jgi:HPt (histidine-containing phosphotransfer) domain-containing protein
MQSTPPARVLSLLGNPDDNKVVQVWLSERGHSLEQAESIEAAQALLEQSEFDLLLLGTSLSQDAAGIGSMRTRQKSGLPVIAGYTVSGRPPACYAAGLCAYLAYPPEMIDLDQTVRGLSLFSGPVFDWEVALANMGMMEIVQEIIKVFLTEAPALLDDVRRTMEQGDLVIIARTAHRFTGGIAVFGEIPCVRAARGLERAAESGADVADAWFWLDQTYSRLYATLQAL